MNKIFYTYVAVDTRKPGKYVYPGMPMSFLYEPFYVGKGLSDRFCSTLGKNSRVRNLMNLLGEASEFTLLVYHDGFESDLSEELALMFEVNFIKLIGQENVLREKLGLPKIKGENEMTDEELDKQPQNATLHNVRAVCEKHGFANETFLSSWIDGQLKELAAFRERPGIDYDLEA